MRIPPNKNKAGWSSQDELVQQTLEYLDDNFDALLDKGDKILASLPDWYKAFQVNKMQRLGEMRFEDLSVNYAEAVAQLDAIYQEYGTQYFLAYKIYKGMNPIYHETHKEHHTKLLRMLEIAPGKVVAEMERYKEEYDKVMANVQANMDKIDKIL